MYTTKIPLPFRNYTGKSVFTRTEICRQNVKATHVVEQRDLSLYNYVSRQIITMRWAKPISDVGDELDGRERRLDNGEREVSIQNCLSGLNDANNKKYWCKKCILRICICFNTL